MEAEDPVVPFVTNSTIYFGAGHPWKPGSTVFLKKSHADDLEAAGHKQELKKNSHAETVSRGEQE